MGKSTIVSHPKHPDIPRVRAVKLLTGFKVHLTFVDGIEREIDLEPYLWGPVFEPIRNDPQMFAAVRVDEEGDTICWSNGADIAPETLYYGDQPAPWAKPEKTKTRRLPRRSAKRTRAKNLKAKMPSK